MSDVVLNVSPTALRQAADGINGVIADLGGGYGGQLGRGFDDLGLTGEQLSHPSVKEGMDNFVERWEWGTRALVTAASDIGHALDLGAGRYELQDDYFYDAAKDVINDMMGDPSLQKESVYTNGNVVSRGTDDMSWREVVEHNNNRSANPDYSARSFEDAVPRMQESWNSFQDNAFQAAMNLDTPAGP